MNCDQAFDYLTDPQRRESPALARHLADCPRCRAMRDALEPALELFHELAAEPDASAIAEGGQSGVSVDSVRLAEQAAASLAGPMPGGRPRLASWRVGLGYAAAALLGAGIALAVHSTVEDPAASGPAQRSRCLWREHDSIAPLEPESELLTAECMRCHFTAWLAPQSAPRWSLSRRDFVRARRPVVLGPADQDQGRSHLHQAFTVVSRETYHATT